MSGSESDESETLVNVSAAARSPIHTPAKSFVARFETNVALVPDQRLYTWLTASCAEEATLTYAEMRARCTAICCALRRKWGAADGDRALLIYPPGLDLLVSTRSPTLNHTDILRVVAYLRDCAGVPSVWDVRTGYPARPARGRAA